MRRAATMAFAALLVAALLPVPARAGSPEVRTVVPRGAKRGTEVEVSFFGRNLHDAQGVLFFRGGIEVTSLEARSKKHVAVRLKISEKCALGEHRLILRTATGLANLETFFVGSLDEVEERAGNQEPASAQEIPLGVTVNGLCQRGQRDHYVFELKQPGRVSIEVEGARLASTAFDAYLEVLDAAGQVIAARDDSAFGRLDPHLSLRLKAGRYYVRVREVAYGGGAGAHYRLHVGDFPRPVGAHPLGVQRNQEIELEFVGDLGPVRRKIKVPRRAPRSWSYRPRDEGGEAPTPIRLLVSGVPNLIEGREQPEKPPEAPFAVNGIVAKPGETDVWTFTGKKGQAVNIAVFARRQRSPLDSVLELTGPGGKSVTADDSGRQPDSRMGVTLQSDGVYTMKIRDHLGRGGPLFLYRVEVTERRPGGKSLRLDPPRANHPMVSVPRGGRMAVTVHGRNYDLDRQVRPIIQGLPKGVTLRSRRFQAGTDVTTLLFEADEKAALAATLGRTAYVSDADGKEERVGYYQNVVMVYVDNNQPFASRRLRQMPVAVTERIPFRVSVEAPRVPLIQGSPIGLKVRVERDEEWKKPVRLRLLWRPPGLSAGRVNVPADRDEVTFYVNAGTNATPGTWPIAIVASADDGGVVQCSSEVFDLTVTKPWVSASIGRCRAERGGEAKLEVALKKSHEFEGAYRIEALNLPRGVKAESPTAQDDSTAVSVGLKLGRRAPLGQHRSVRLRMHIPAPGGGSVIQDVRGIELWIDRPLRRGKGEAAPAVEVTRGTVANPKT